MTLKSSEDESFASSAAPLRIKGMPSLDFTHVVFVPAKVSAGLLGSKLGGQEKTSIRKVDQT
jgi:hypothetical protein